LPGSVWIEQRRTTGQGEQRATVKYRSGGRNTPAKTLGTFGPEEAERVQQQARALLDAGLDPSEVLQGGRGPRASASAHLSQKEQAAVWHVWDTLLAVDLARMRWLTDFTDTAHEAMKATWEARDAAVVAALRAGVSLRDLRKLTGLGAGAVAHAAHRHGADELILASQDTIKLVAWGTPTSDLSLQVGVEVARLRALSRSAEAKQLLAAAQDFFETWRQALRARTTSPVATRVLDEIGETLAEHFSERELREWEETVGDGDREPKFY
jgi:hypothetical protein